jgi:hypothetical protein
MKMIRTMAVTFAVLSGLTLAACDHDGSSYKDSTTEPKMQPKPTEQQTKTPQVPASPAPATR